MVRFEEGAAVVVGAGAGVGAGFGAGVGAAIVFLTVTVCADFGFGAGVVTVTVGVAVVATWAAATVLIPLEDPHPVSAAAAAAAASASSTRVVYFMEVIGPVLFAHAMLARAFSGTSIKRLSRGVRAARVGDTRDSLPVGQSIDGNRLNLDHPLRLRAQA